MNYRLKKGRLGDIIASLYAFENTGIQTNSQFKVQLETKYLEAFNCFEFKHVCTTEKADVDLPMLLKSLNAECFCPSVVSRFAGHYTYINILQIYLNKKYGYDLSNSLPLHSSIKKHPRRYDFYIQFDGQTAKEQDRSLTNNEIKAIMRGRDNWACLGGPGTKQYIKGDKFFIPLPNIISRLKNCDSLLGCDSGLSHLAGALGIPQEVYIKGECYHCLKSYYEQAYKNCIVKRVV